MDNCNVCGAELEDTEFYVCTFCADNFLDEDEEDAETIDFFVNRFDSETEAEYKVRKENKW